MSTESFIHDVTVDVNTSYYPLLDSFFASHGTLQEVKRQVIRKSTEDYYNVLDYDIPSSSFRIEE